ncbi:hypothetical protein WA026_013426 [Henosepilachna vigintioctopunctata]|uniref:Uncharacterized protein n=1 Tax=Henosepilachna vigintioctopunctata TaxID=420089 RepID=A0AAW1VEY6_9CUCU
MADKCRVFPSLKAIFRHSSYVGIAVSANDPVKGELLSIPYQLIDDNFVYYLYTIPTRAFQQFSSLHCSPELRNLPRINPLVRTRARFDKIVPSFDEIVPRFDDIVSRFDEIVPRFDEMGPRFDEIIPGLTKSCPGLTKSCPH